VEKFRKYRFADVGKSKLGKKETCAKHKIDRSQNGRSNKSLLTYLPNLIRGHESELWCCCHIYGSIRVCLDMCEVTRTASDLQLSYAMAGSMLRELLQVSDCIRYTSSFTAITSRKANAQLTFPLSVNSTVYKQSSFSQFTSNKISDSVIEVYRGINGDQDLSRLTTLMLSSLDVGRSQIDKIAGCP